MYKEEVFSGEKVSLDEMLSAREKRSFRQMSLLSKLPDLNLLSVTMNIPGDVKTSPILSEVFSKVLMTVRESFKKEEIIEDYFLSPSTGYEYYCLTSLPLEQLKEQMIDIEVTHPLGRLFDLDVIWLQNGNLQMISRKDLGLSARRCFICSDDAKVCGRSRKHTIDDMQEYIANLIARTNFGGKK